MCTVTYLPKEKGKFLLTSNRDESPNRHGSGIQTLSKREETLFYPEVPDTPGSWICISNSGTVLCLLNGAFGTIPHDRTFPRSRGSVILDFFDFRNTKEYLEHFDPSGLAPFTLIILQHGNCTKQIWDNDQTYVEELDPDKPYIWSSSTLYPPPVRAWRESLFAEWLKKQSDFTWEGILEFHRSGGAGDPKNGLLMNRADQVKTLSITSVYHQIEQLDFSYFDLIHQQTTRRRIQPPYAKVPS
jgi:uncharacterized protein with NRDE domain